jgi:hypothetical protein
MRLSDYQAQLDRIENDDTLDEPARASALLGIIREMDHLAAASSGDTREHATQLANRARTLLPVSGTVS